MSRISISIEMDECLRLDGWGSLKGFLNILQVVYLSVMVLTVLRGRETLAQVSREDSISIVMLCFLALIIGSALL